MVSGNTETNVTVTYQDSDGTLDFAVSATDSTAIVDGDSDTKIQVEEHLMKMWSYDVAGTEVATQNASGLHLQQTLEL